MNVTDAERIETIVLTKSTGLMGRYVPLSRAAKWDVRVELLDRHLHVRMVYLVRCLDKWEVSVFGEVFRSRNLLDACREAVQFAERMNGLSVATRGVEV